MTKMLTLCLAAVAITAPIVAQGVDLRDLRHLFEERYEAMKSAMANGDANALSAMLTSDFVSTDISGQTENAPQMIEEVKKLSPDPHRTSKTTIRSVEVNDSTARVEQSYDMRTVKTASDGKEQHILLTTLSEDVWVLSKGVWLCRSTTTNQLDYFINGQAIAHRTRQR